MKTFALALLAALALSACSFDRTLETLVPANAYAVVYVEHPSLTAQLLGQPPGDLPWASLDGGKPWAAAALTGSTPVAFVALALADKPGAWSDVEAWARGKTGLAAARAGSYAVLTSGPTPDGPRFDLSRVRTGDLVSVYVDVKNVLDAAAGYGASFVPAPAAAALRQNAAGLHVGFAPKDGGIAVTVSSDLRADAPIRPLLRALARSPRLADWTGLFPSGDGVRLAASLPPELITAAGNLLNDPSWNAHWAALAPLLGPGLAVSASPRADGSWGWAAAVETSDPKAVRQALKTLVAGGDLQKRFASWSIDADTPLIYQDKPDGDGIRTQVTLGAETIQLAWGDDRVALAGGAGASEALLTWKRPARSPAPWFGQVPSGAAVAGEGVMGGLGARGSVRVLSDGNLELAVWTDAAGLKAWEAQAPQALLGWLGGAGGSKR
jgi:hypothetical protein